MDPKERHKTGIMCNVPLLDITLEVIEMYKDHPLCRKRGILLPVLSNQKMNSYLKEIADCCGIKNNLSTHTGRHTFCSVVTLANNVSLENIENGRTHEHPNVYALCKSLRPEPYLTPAIALGYPDWYIVARESYFELTLPCSNFI